MNGLWHEIDERMQGCVDVTTYPAAKQTYNIVWSLLSHYDPGLITGQDQAINWKMQQQ